MKTLKEQTEFYSVFSETKVIETQVLNEPLVLDLISQYVANNPINNRQFKVHHMDIHEYPMRITVHLIDVETKSEPDEDMCPDKKLNSFFEEVAKKCKCGYISVPYYYYGK